MGTLSASQHNTLPLTIGRFMVWLGETTAARGRMTLADQLVRPPLALLELVTGFYTAIEPAFTPDSTTVTLDAAVLPQLAARIANEEIDTFMFESYPSELWLAANPQYEETLATEFVRARVLRAMEQSRLPAGDIASIKMENDNRCRLRDVAGTTRLFFARISGKKPAPSGVTADGKLRRLTLTELFLLEGLKACICPERRMRRELHVLAG